MTHPDSSPGGREVAVPHRSSTVAPRGGPSHSPGEVTTCACGEEIRSEAAAQRHAKACHLQGYPSRRELARRRFTYIYALRYIPGTDLAHRYPGLARGQFKTREEAENVRRHCPNADQIEVVDVREVS